MSLAALRMVDIVKDFPGVRALDQVCFEARFGEVLALVGENGAGKSTLMKVLSGVLPYPTYEGHFYVKDRQRRFSGTKEAEAAGIAIIHQELNLVPGMSVAENIFLERQPTKGLGLIDWPLLHRLAADYLRQLGVHSVAPTDLVRELSVGAQQMVEIAKALSLDADILVLDEPTSALTDKETQKLFETVKNLRQSNVCIVYISHKMEEIALLADRVVVLRDGKTIGDVTPLAEIPISEIIRRMVGRELDQMYPRTRLPPGEKTLEVRSFSVDHPQIPGAKKVDNVSFAARKGEILGIAGLMGSGRTELVTGVFGGLGKDAKGECYLNGARLRIESPKDAIEAGIALVPEDRKSLGLVLGASTLHNMTLSSLGDYRTCLGTLDRIAENREARKYARALGIKAADIDAEVDCLSGGNQQKVVLAKWLMVKPQVLILDEPTRGIDVGAKAEIYKIIDGLVGQGVTVIIVSSELSEILGMCDRIVVMRKGRLVADLDRAHTTKERIMEYATGTNGMGAMAP